MIGRRRLTHFSMHVCELVSQAYVVESAIEDNLGTFPANSSCKDSSNVAGYKR